jgi:YidC/Oxa1 family membrane protein insertase
VTVETAVLRATLTSRGGRLASLALKQFRRSVDADSPPLELVEQSALLPLTVMLDATHSDAAVAYKPNLTVLNLAPDGTGEIVFSGTTASGLALEKRVRFLGNSYVIDVEVRASGPTLPRSVSLVVPHLEREGVKASGGNASEAAVILSEGKITETRLNDAKIDDLKPQSASGARWVAFTVPFFAAAVLAPTPSGGVASVERVGSKAVIRMEEPLEAGAALFKVFMGPKSKEILADAGFDLSRLLDFGWFWFIAVPMLYALRFLHRVTGNYGVDIILLTALVRAATIPLTQKSFRSMKDMQKIQPQLKRLQEQYKDDQTKLQKEMMELYKRHGVNPFSGCAPMFLQIPIFVGLYNALLHAIELRHAPFALWITDLSAPERLFVAGIGIPVMTIVMGGTMLVQQWLTPQQGDPTQRQMMMIMPVVFTFMFFNFPSGLVLYWLVSNLLGITQQYLMLRPTK